MRNRRIAAIVLAVAMAADRRRDERQRSTGTPTHDADARRPRPAASSASSWESSFGFTDGFDPTGEYLGEAFGIYSNLLVRTLVGYNHVAGAAGQHARPDLATTVAEADERRQDVHVPPQERHQVRPAASTARSPRRTSLYALERIAHPKDGGAVRASTTT